jgi:hypothetical protein
MSNEKIVIPEQFWVSYSDREDQYYDPTTGKYVKLGATKLGFATYQEDNAAFRKRQATILGWANKKYIGETKENAARNGFKLSKMVTHGGGWNDTSVYWRVMDPDGFELEITAGNVAKLFQYCCIDKGSIHGECVWGWDKGNGSKVVLIPVNSELYIESRASTDVHYAKSLAIKDLAIGDGVELKNGEKGTFFGKVSFGYYSTELKDYGRIAVESTYVFQTAKDRLFFMATPAVIKAKSNVVYTKAEAEEHLNKLLTKPFNIQLASSKKYYGSQIRFFSYDDPKTIKAELILQEQSSEAFILMMRKSIKDKYTSSIHNLRYYHTAKIVTLENGQRFLLEGAAQTDHRDKTVAQERMKQFQAGEVANLQMIGYRLFYPTINAEAGITIERNPHWTEDESRYSYRREKYEVPVNFYLFDIVKIEDVYVQHKDVIRPIGKDYS